MYSSTYFGRPHAHHQVLNNCSSSLWFYRLSMVIAVLLVVVSVVSDFNISPKMLYTILKTGKKAQYLSITR